MPARTISAHAPGRMRKRVLGVLVITVVLATLITFFSARHYFERLESQAASNRMVIYLRALNETLRQHQHLPFVLANDPRYAQDLAAGTTGPETNDRLRELAHEAKLEAIYLMDPTGRVVATSNADEPHSFLGQNYGFRPYFRDALTGQRSDYFAIGATSGRPGYFVAEPVFGAGAEALGVIAIKLDVSELQRSWESNSETVLAVNNDKIVVLASNPGWLYRPVGSLSDTLRKTILGSRQFGSETLKPLGWQPFGDKRVTIDGTGYLQVAGQAEWRGWTLHYLHPENTILRQTLVATVFCASIISVLLGFATFLRSRRIEQAYTASERRRVALVQTNQQLEKAQTDLAQSAKLAALGHLAASVTHELGQPISAFRNHLVAAELGHEITSPTTAMALYKLVDRMEATISQFRHFARARPEHKSQVDLIAVLGDAKTLLQADIAAAGIHLVVNEPHGPVPVYAHEVQLEQAFTNLLRNAVHAVEGRDNPQIRLTLTRQMQQVEIRIQDNGPGLSGATLTDLQEPFFSTKPSGVGMGLGLAITTEIINDHGGALTLGDVTEGAEFVVTLPLTSSKDLT